MKIHKVFNNNFASIIDENGNAIIVMGRGIALRKKSGDELEESRIDKKFCLGDQRLEGVKYLLNEIPLPYMKITNETIEFAKITLN